MQPRQWSIVSGAVGGLLGFAVMMSASPDTGPGVADVPPPPDDVALPAPALPAVPSGAPAVTSNVRATLPSELTPDLLRTLSTPVERPKTPITSRDELGVVKTLDGKTLPADVRGLSLLFRERQPEVDACWTGSGYDRANRPEDGRMTIMVHLEVSDDDLAYVSDITAPQDDEQYRSFLGCVASSVEDVPMETQATRQAQMMWNLKIPR